MSISLPWYYYWILPVFVGVPLLVRVLGAATKAWRDEQRYARAGLQDVKRMHWRDFEKYLAHLFQSLGYQVELTPPSGDFGVDVILTDRQGRRTAVQAKHWKSKQVGSPDVQKTIGGAKYYNCEDVLVVTTSSYTDQARAVARKTGVKLWGIKELGDAMAAAGAPGASAARAVPATPIAATPIAAAQMAQPAHSAPPQPARPQPTQPQPTQPQAARPQPARPQPAAKPDSPPVPTAHRQ